MIGTKLYIGRLSFFSGKEMIMLKNYYYSPISNPEFYGMEGELSMYLSIIFISFFFFLFLLCILSTFFMGCMKETVFQQMSKEYLAIQSNLF